MFCACLVGSEMVIGARVCFCLLWAALVWSGVLCAAFFNKCRVVIQLLGFGDGLLWAALGCSGLLWAALGWFGPVCSGLFSTLSLVVDLLQHGYVLHLPIFLCARLLAALYILSLMLISRCR